MNFTSIADEMAAAISNESSETLIKKFDFNAPFENELLFFFKPECFQVADVDDTKKIIDLAITKFKEFNVSLSGALLLRGKRLEELGIMDRHYGYINLLSRSASKILNQEDLKSIGEQLEYNRIEDISVLGGHEFLLMHPEFDENSLEKFWATKKSLKLRSGFYFQRYILNGKEFVLINGFHPSQLRHFTNPKHLIIICLLQSNTGWKELKNNFVGNTFPEKADPNSIRGTLYRDSKKYGAKDVSIANNFVHLSAGPFEAFFELQNFLSKLKSVQFSIEDTNLFKLMVQQGLEKEEIEKSLINPSQHIDGKDVDLFSLTEEVNSTDAIQVFLSKILLKRNNV